MAYFWRCPHCDTLGTYDDDERPWCFNQEGCPEGVADATFGPIPEDQMKPPEHWRG